MDEVRIHREIAEAKSRFAFIEARPSLFGGTYAKAVLQTTAGTQYCLTIGLPDYPNRIPKVVITSPSLALIVPHRYQEGHICYLHPAKWNPAIHNVAFVLARTAKWLNKYEIWRRSGRWPGAELRH